MKKQKLTINEIVEKEFKKKKIGGIDKEEVDEYLNDIIEDYEYFAFTIKTLKETNEQLRNENFKIKMNVLKQNTSNLDFEDIKQNTVEVPTTNNFDVEPKDATTEDVSNDTKAQEDRISALEKAIEELKNIK